MVLIRRKSNIFLYKLLQKTRYRPFWSSGHYVLWYVGVNSDSDIIFHRISESFAHSRSALKYETIRRHHYCVTRDCEQFTADIQKATLHENGTRLHGTFTHNPKACCTNTPMSFGDRRSESTGSTSGGRVKTKSSLVCLWYVVLKKG